MNLFYTNKIKNKELFNYLRKIAKTPKTPITNTVKTDMNKQVIIIAITRRYLNKRQR